MSPPVALNSAILAREPSTSSRRTNKGAEIRARIAANRAKRLEIADATKREACVTEHTVHEEDFGGLAYIGTGKIWSPEGRKIVQLYTLAHECGHSFLHNSGPRWPAPFAPRPLQLLHYYYEAVRPSPAHRYFRPRSLSHLCLFPSHRRRGSHVPYKSLVELRAIYMPDVARSVSGHPPS